MSKLAIVEPSEEEIKQAVLKVRAQLGSDADKINTQLLTGKEGGLTDTVVRRFLRVTSYNLTTAESKLRSFAAWREGHPIGWVPYDNVKSVLIGNTVYLQGLGKLGEPLLVLKVKAYTADSQREHFEQLLMFCLDSAMMQADASADPDRAVCMIFDLEGAGRNNITLAELRTLVDLLQSYYAGRLTKIWVYQPPFFFSALWHLITPFLSPRAKYVLDFTYKKEVPAKLEEFYTRQVIPSDYGGEATLRKLDDVVHK